MFPIHSKSTLKLFGTVLKCIISDEKSGNIIHVPVKRFLLKICFIYKTNMKYIDWNYILQAKRSDPVHVQRGSTKVPGYIFKSGKVLHLNIY